MPLINLFRRSTKATTESSCSIGTKLKKSKLAKKASVLNQKLHAKQAQFKISIDNNCHKIGNFVDSKIKQIRHHKGNNNNNLDSTLELNEGATPYLAPLVADEPEQDSFGECLEEEIDYDVRSLRPPSSCYSEVVDMTDEEYQARQERILSKKVQLEEAERKHANMKKLCEAFEAWRYLPEDQYREQVERCWDECCH